jgi:CubicO group peptidase (beta-lactamase class C family)
LAPAWEWPRSTPEEQGILSARLAVMLEKVQQEKRNLHSILIIRHGVLVMEAHVHPFNAQTRHNLYSAAKSVTSTLVGIAAGDGLIDIYMPVRTYFPDVTIEDDWKDYIRVEHLLAMTSGIEWTEPLHSGLNDLWGIHESDDPAQYFFNPAVLTEPGTAFNYNSGGSHMLSMLIQKTTGLTAADYAEKKLFAPLDIRDTYWKKDFTGHTQGGTGLEMRPADMAKIGQVMLDGGVWQGKRVLPAGWTAAATQKRATSSPGFDYGFQWWLRPKGDYYALGWGGQQIHVFPQQDMVVVITAGLAGNAILHQDLIDSYILTAVKTDQPLTADKQGYERLEKAVEALAAPRVFTAGPLSDLAEQADGLTWLVTGMGEWNMFTLHFPNDTEGSIELTLDGAPMRLAMGLDGYYRVTDTAELGPVALLGWWESYDTFVVQQQNLRDADRRTTRLQFSNDGVRMVSRWLADPYVEVSQAELFGQ